MATKPVKAPVEKTAVESAPVAAAEALQDAADKTAAAVQEAAASLTEKIEMPAAAREFVERTTATAKERLAEAHAGANNATVTFEKAIGSFANAHAAAMRGLLQASYDNSLAALATFEKLAAAKSLQEAYGIQSEFARELAAANWARAQSVAETMKANMQESVRLLQDEAAKAIDLAKKAA